MAVSTFCISFGIFLSAASFRCLKFPLTLFITSFFFAADPSFCLTIIKEKTHVF